MLIKKEKKWVILILMMMKSQITYEITLKRDPFKTWDNTAGIRVNGSWAQILGKEKAP